MNTVSGKNRLQLWISAAAATIGLGGCAGLVGGGGHGTLPKQPDGSVVVALRHTARTLTIPAATQAQFGDPRYFAMQSEPVDLVEFHSPGGGRVESIKIVELRQTYASGEELFASVKATTTLPKFIVAEVTDALVELQYTARDDHYKVYMVYARFTKLANGRWMKCAGVGDASEIAKQVCGNLEGA